MKLYIAEKKSLAETVAAALHGRFEKYDGYLIAGGDVFCYCSGHLLELAQPNEYDERYRSWDIGLLPIIPESFRIRPSSKKNELGRAIVIDGKVQPDPRILKMISTIKKMLGQCRSVVHVGDADREGQLIVDEVLRFLGNRKDVGRLWLTDQNATAIKDKANNMPSNKSYERLGYAAAARAEADWLIGMNMTRGFTSVWSGVGNSGVTPVGRVQTPVLNLIVQREKEIAEFVPVKHFRIVLKLKTALGMMAADVALIPDQFNLDSEGRLTSRSEAEATVRLFCQGGRLEAGMLSSFAREQCVQHQPLPYDLGSLQKECYRKFGMSPSDTMTVAQALYEKYKVTTYPRTERKHLPESTLKMAGEIIETIRSNLGAKLDFANSPDLGVRSKAWDDSKVSEHFGIMPTTRRVDTQEMDPREFAVYHLICRRFFAQFFEPFIYEKEKAEFLMGESHIVIATGIRHLKTGWRAVDETGMPEHSPLPCSEQGDRRTWVHLKTGDPAVCLDAQIKDAATTPPSFFNADSIISAMERPDRFVSTPSIKAKLRETGLGTAATRYKVIERLLGDGYIFSEGTGSKTHYRASEKGTAFIKMVCDELRKPDITVWFEDELRKIESGEAVQANFRELQSRFVKKLVDNLRAGIAEGTVTAQRLNCQTPEAPAKQAGLKQAVAKPTKRKANPDVRK